MAAGPQDAPRNAGQVVRRVLLRRNIASAAETAQFVTPPSRQPSDPIHLPGWFAGQGLRPGQGVKAPGQQALVPQEPVG